MTRTLMLVAAGCGAVLLVGAAGCSGSRGCRTCERPAAVALPPHPPVAAAHTAAPAPAARYGGQVKCPVTGEELGSMGEPVAVAVGGRTVYVCCRGCAKRAEADPTKTLAARSAPRPWEARSVGFRGICARQPLSGLGRPGD